MLQPETGRRGVLRGIVGLGLLGGGLWLGGHSESGRTLLADLRTGTGERRSVSLNDGSRLQLNADSAVDCDFSAQRRLLRLYRGALVVQVAADPERPFIVRSDQGDILSLIHI